MTDSLPDHPPPPEPVAHSDGEDSGPPESMWIAPPEPFAGASPFPAPQMEEFLGSDDRPSERIDLSDEN